MTARTNSQNIPTFLIALPAYGRDYTTREQVIQDWEAGKDFRLEMPGFAIDGKYINKDDKPATSWLNIRYAKAAQFVVIGFDGSVLNDDAD